MQIQGLLSLSNFAAHKEIQGATVSCEMAGIEPRTAQKHNSPLVYPFLIAELPGGKVDLAQEGTETFLLLYKREISAQRQILAEKIQ